MSEGRRTPQDSRRRHSMADDVTGLGCEPQRGDLVYDTGKHRVGVVTALPEDTGTTTYQLSAEGGGGGWTAPAVRLTFSATVSNDSGSSAVLYVCVERSPGAHALAEERAVQEGRAFAQQRALRILAEIADPCGEPDPGSRGGWLRVRALAEGGGVSVAIVRWPSVISADPDLRRAEMVRLQGHGVRVLFSWAPLSAWQAVGR
ncbi:hypothetical protein [Streptomyces sp. NPDC005955]|uniref:hypothetical protein n=1 Tax=Streptomyces sp. NPDC005955 TaxID=3364738 RepID=UPI00368A8DB5